MQRFSVRFSILISILFLFFCGIAFIQYWHSIHPISIDFSRIPINIGQWQDENITVDKKIKDTLKTDSILIRKYKKGGSSIWLAIVYYKDNRVSLGLAQGCSEGYSSYIVKKDLQEVTLSTGKSFLVNRLILKGEKINQVMAYYFEADGLRTSNYLAMRWQMILNKFNPKSNAGALVKFSVTADKNPRKTTEMLKDFISQAAPLISKNLFD